MHDRERERKNSPAGKVISIALALLFLLPSEFIGWLVALAVVVVPFVLIFRFALRGRTRPGNTAPKAEPFDDCPKPICFHRDKGEHHVKRGKEIDPWDRPDIDISKYQRR